MPVSVAEHIDRQAARVRSESSAQTVQQAHGAWLPMMIALAAVFWVALGTLVLHLIT